MEATNRRPSERMLHRAHASRDELVERIAQVVRGDGTVELLPGLQLYRASAPTGLAHGVSFPSLCLVAQGSKELRLGDNRYRYNPAQYLISTVSLPIATWISEASPERPYLGLVLRLDQSLVGSVLVEASQRAPRNATAVTAIDVSPLDANLLDVVVRLIRLLDSPTDVSFLAPMVMPGDYTAKLKVGDSTYTTTIKVVHDASNKEFTPEDRKLQYKTAMDIYKMHEDLAKTVDTINARQKLIKDNLNKVTDSSLKKMMVQYNDELEKLRSECLASKQKSIFADEKKLREEITDVYGAVCGQEAAPSNLQAQRVTVLQQQVKTKEQQKNTILKKYDKQVMDGLKKEGLIGPAEKKPF